MTEESAPKRAGAVIAGGAGWKLATQLVTIVTRAGVAVLLARLLTPTDFGVAALALVFTTLVFVFTDFGSVLVQSREPTEEDRSTTFWISLAAGAVLTVLGVAMAPLIAAFFNEPEVRPLFTVLSLTFVLTAAATTQSALLHRAMAFRRVELAGMVAVLCGATAGVVVALSGGGAWAIILQQVANSVAYLLLLWFASPWRPRLVFSRPSARRVLGFNSHLIGAQIFSFVNKNIDSLLIGRFLGAAPLGVYTLSYNLMLYPVQRVADPISQAMFPVLSRMQDDDERMARIWLHVMRLTAAVVMPLMVGLVVLAPQFVGVVLGAKWSEAAPVIQCLAWTGIIYTLNGVTLSVVLAKGMTRTIFRWTIMSTVLLVGGIVIGLQFGIVGVAAAISLAAAAVWPVVVAVTARAVGIPFGRYWRNLTAIVAATAAMAAFALPFRLLLERLGLPQVAILAAVVASAAALYAGLCLWWDGAIRQDVLAGLAKVRRRRPGAAGPPPGGGQEPQAGQVAAG